MIKWKTLKDVYPPSEDSYLLFDSIKIRKKLRKGADIGTGNGLIALKLASLSEYVLASDINFMACKNVSLNAKINNLDIDIICGDLLSFVRKEYKFDIITFNPPYLPVNEKNSMIELSWSGGKDGIEVIKKFLRQARNFLSNKGSIYVVLSNLMNLRKLFLYIKKKGYKFGIIKKKSLGFFEDIMVVKLKKSPSLQ